MIHNRFINYKHFSNEPEKIKTHLAYHKRIIQFLLKSAKNNEALSKLLHEAIEHKGHWLILVA